MRRLTPTLLTVAALLGAPAQAEEKKSGYGASRVGETQAPVEVPNVKLTVPPVGKTVPAQKVEPVDEKVDPPTHLKLPAGTSLPSPGRKATSPGAPIPGVPLEAPDLRLSAVYEASGPYALRVVVHNEGNADAVGPFRVQVTQCKYWRRPDAEKKDCTLPSFTVNSVRPGATVDHKFQRRMFTASHYELTVEVDPTRRVRERAENNNTTTIRFDNTAG